MTTTERTGRQMKKNNEDKKKTRGQQKTWDMNYVRGKYDLSVEEAQIVAQKCLTPGKHIKEGRILKIGLIEIGKYIKNNPFPKKEAPPEDDGRIIETLYTTVKKPPNKRRLWVARMDGSNYTSGKMVCIVSEKVWEGCADKTPLQCEKIDEGLWRHPPLEKK